MTMRRAFGPWGRALRAAAALALLAAMVCAFSVNAQPADAFARAVRGDLLLPSAPGEGGVHVLLLQQALAALGFFTDPPDGYYAKATSLAVEAFQRARSLRVSGVADAQTMRVLQGGPDGDKPRTVMLWWYGEGGGAVPPGAEFTVRDVWTGETFRCMRTEGFSHMDAEPRTMEDAAVMKRVYGGTWAWARRPILVKYGELVIAASMNGMPHGTDFLPGNAMQGHFCIHFYGSRIDGSQTVDARHQMCVAEALYARWE